MGKQVDDVFIEHADAAMRSRLSDEVRTMCSMDIDIAGKGIYPTASVDAGLGSLQPQDAGQNPVLFWVVALLIKDADWLACDKDCSGGVVLTDQGGDAMSSDGRLQTVSCIATAFRSGGNRISYADPTGPAVN